MEDRLKERLTGASLLVVLVVVLVPAMFRGERPGAADADVATGGATAPQVYTIDLKGAAPAAPEPSTPPASPAAAPATLPADAPAAVDGQAGTAASPSIARAPVIRESPPPAETRPAPPAPPAPLPARPPAARPADSAPPPAAVRGAPATAGFVVQVGSFGKHENAVVMVKQAARKGLRLTVAGPDDRGLFRVRSSVVRTRQEALALQEKLQAQGFKGLVGAVN